MTLIDILNTMTTANSETIFKSLVDIIRWLHQEDAKKQSQLRSGPQARRKSTLGISVHNMDSVVLDFTMAVCEWGTKQMTDNSWAFLTNFAREVVLSHNSNAILLMMKAIDGFLAKPPKLQNRRVKREVQEISQKVIDTVMSIANRAFVDLSAPIKSEVRFTYGKETPIGTLSQNSNSSPNLSRPEEADSSVRPAVPFLVTEDNEPPAATHATRSSSVGDGVTGMSTELDSFDGSSITTSPIVLNDLCSLLTRTIRNGCSTGEESPVTARVAAVLAALDDIP
jgi:hypothetical protein